MKANSFILIGMAGVGKSTIGAELAATLKLDFVDLDEYIFERDGRTVQNILDSEGEQGFLQLEERSVLEIELDQVVIAPGGSIIYLPELMEHLKRFAILVFLDDSFENIEKRLKNASSRGIVGLKTRSLRQIYDERHLLYARYADISIEVTGKSPDEVVQEILKNVELLRA